MTESMIEYLQQDMECEGLLECIHGLTALDRQVFGVLADATEPLTVDEIAARVDRERSTAYRSIKRLVEAGFARKEQVNYDHGGYYHVYRPADPAEIAADMQRTLDEWHDTIGELISEFREKYDGRATRAASAEN